MDRISIDKALIQKFNRPGPRYTSYPTAPEWRDDFTDEDYRGKLRSFAVGDKTLSLYVHLPFCQSLCYFCACNVLIRDPESRVGDQYLGYLFKEIDLVCSMLGEKRNVKQLHWGGGTPTFLNESQIARLFEKITASFDVDLAQEIAVEIDPRTIDRKKLAMIRTLGFNRVSMGIQDFDAAVQRHVNRVQPFETVERLCSWCREERFQSINVDLIYGLPGQSRESFRHTVERVVELKPDRIALYSFAHVPWLKKHQQKLDTAKLPMPEEKLDIFLMAREGFMGNGYQAIAMDHFALNNDELTRAYKNGTLYRNFMGYTVKPADEYLGIGLSSIGYLESTYVHNHKVLKDYYRCLDEGRLPVHRGIVLSEDDRMRQWVINALMCRFCVDKEAFRKKFRSSFDEYFQEEQPHIERCRREGLLREDKGLLKATETGKIFIRNVCMGFDRYLRTRKENQRFSRTV